jgi:hypothetical protein
MRPVVREIDLKRQIVEGAAKIRQLDARIHGTLLYRSDSAEDHRKWQDACREFHAAYDRLAFPGGYEGAAQRILAGDALAVEAAICFLESRPYFFRSGYMFKAILRKVRRAPLSEDQSARLRHVLARLALWRARKKQNLTDGADARARSACSCQ